MFQHFLLHKCSPPSRQVIEPFPTMGMPLIVRSMNLPSVGNTGGVFMLMMSLLLCRKWSIKALFDRFHQNAENLQATENGIFLCWELCQGIAAHGFTAVFLSALLQCVAHIILEGFFILQQIRHSKHLSFYNVH